MSSTITVRSYLQANCSTMNRVAFFCTCGGAGQDKVLQDMRALCCRRPVATLAVTRAQFGQDSYRSGIDQFVQQIQAAQMAHHSDSRPTR